MQRYVLIVSAVIVTIIFALQGFKVVYPMPQAVAVEAGQDNTGSDPEKALSEIYFDVQIMGVQQATRDNLELDFGLDPGIVSAVYGRYTDGRFGIADVLILRPRYGCEDEVREALQNVKTTRINLFKNYDIFDAHRIAQDGVVFTRGEYCVLIMIEDAQAAREIIEQYIER